MENSAILFQNKNSVNSLTYNRNCQLNRLCYLFLIFLTGCLMGWIYEEIFYWITEGLLQNRGILYGLWLPIYGIGAIVIYAMKPLKKHPLQLFLLCVVASGVVEYIIGFVGIHYLLEPVAEKLYLKISAKIIQSTCFVLVMLFVIDCILSFLFRTPITY